MASSLVDLVNPLMGTRSIREYSRGNTLPLVQRPWGMTAWSFVTSAEPWYFHPDLPKLRGLRATRQPSPWIGDYGAFTLCPQSGPLVTDAVRRASAYRLDRSVVSPHRVKTEFLRYRVVAELAPTERCAVLKLTFAEGGACRLLVEVSRGALGYHADAREFRGTSTAAEGGVPKDFAQSFLIVFDKPVARSGAEGTLAWVEFDLPRGASVEARIATSFLGFDQARVTLKRELGTKALEEVAAEGASRWNRLLGRLAVEGGTDDQRKTFYSCLYRALCFPRKAHEYDADGNPVHLDFSTGKTALGVLCADNGFWDTHRTVYPLYALAYRDELPEILEGWLSFARDGGWLPTWSSPGPRACMIGTHIDAVFAEAVAKNVTGFDLEAAWTALRRHAFEAPPAPEVGRADLPDYLALGYLPDGKGIHSVSATLDYAYGDWCLSQIARALGKPEALPLEDRSKKWQTLFDASMGFFRPRNADGSWTDGFNPLAWGGPFVEGSAWQCGWAVPHDPEGLIAALGGPEVALARLDTLLALKPMFQVGTYTEEIHEMTEMAVADFGQYAHSNQPSHGILWFYALAGRPDKTEKLTRRVLDELYGPGVDGFCGDEDNGEMGAWYVWAALGLYPLCPGSPDYVLGSPLFLKATVDSGDGRTLTIEAPGNSAETPIVLKRTLANLVLSEPRVSHADLFDLGRLVCEMGGPETLSRTNEGSRP